MVLSFEALIWSVVYFGKHLWINNWSIIQYQTQLLIKMTVCVCVFFLLNKKIGDCMVWGSQVWFWIRSLLSITQAPGVLRTPNPGSVVGASWAKYFMAAFLDHASMFPTTKASIPYTLFMHLIKFNTCIDGRISCKIWMAQPCWIIWINWLNMK